MNSDKGAGDGRGRSGGTALLRGAVSCYLAYLGYTLLRDYAGADSALPAWQVWLFGILFLGAGIGFGWYTWRRYRAETKAAEDQKADQSGEKDGDPS